MKWLKEVDSKALQSSLQDLENAYNNFFRSIKNNKKNGFPKFKSKKNSKKSFKTKTRIKILEDKIQLPKLALIKCKISKKVEGRIISAFVSQNASGRYFVTICVTDFEPIKLEKSGCVVGIDLGIKDFAITSDGIKYSNPKFFNKSQKKLAKLQRQLSRKSSGSKRRNKARIKVAKQYERVHNQRIDFLQKLSTNLIKTYDIIAIEDLASSNMYGKIVVRIDRFYPSSQLCSVCGAKWSGTKDLNVRKWICSECGIEHDRDINASVNILNEGLRVLNQ